MGQTRLGWSFLPLMEGGGGGCVQACNQTQRLYNRPELNEH